MNTIARRCLIIGSFAVLTACGGGGGGSGGGGAPAAPQSGDLDTSFGTNGNGKVVTEFYAGIGGARGRATAVQADGKIVVAGWASPGGADGKDFALARYNPDGSRDTTFNDNPRVCSIPRPCNGLLVTDFSGGTDSAYALAIQTDGKIVVAGSSYNGTDFDFALARYNPDGSPDTGFGTAGTVTTGFFAGQDDHAYAVAIQANGRIVVAGVARNGADDDVALARFNTDGTLDTSFNDNLGLCLVSLPCRGKLASLSPVRDGARALAIQGDGKLVVAGYAYNATSWDFLVVRYNSNGSLDTAGFGSGTGKVQTGFFAGQDDYAYAVALQSDGKIVVAGSAYDGTDYDFALARYNSDGALDTSFNYQSLCAVGYPCSGQQYTNFGRGYSSEALAIALQADGGIVAGGWAMQGDVGSRDFALARYNVDGGLDTRFGSGGKTTTAFTDGFDYAFAVALQADGKIVAAGTSDDDSGFAVARYLP